MKPPRAYARGILHFFGAIRRSTLLAYSAEAAASAAKAGRSPSFGGSPLRIHSWSYAHGLLRRRIKKQLPVLYPITGHWIWGGGWLANLGMWDFAGSTVVHSVGGWAALAGAIMLGPRLGKYTAEGRINPIPGHSITSATIGVFVLWFGCFGFNPGSTMAADWRAIGHIAVTTNTAAAAGVVAATFFAWVVLGKPDLTMALKGGIASLVAITAPCAFVSVGSSIIIGIVAGTLVVLSVLFFDRIRVDDPVGAISAHLICGIWGTLALGLFAQDQFMPGTTGNGLLFGGELKPSLPNWSELSL